MKLRAKPPAGLWQGEWQCGSCGTVDNHFAQRHGPGKPHSLAGRRRLCRAVYMGRPKNTCGWKMSFVWIWVPPGGRGS